MFGALTSKGQLSLPKEIRDRLNLDAGAILDFQIQADNTISARRVLPDARRIRGLLESPHAAPMTVEQMDEAVSKHLRDKHATRQAGRKSTGRKPVADLYRIHPASSNQTLAQTLCSAVTRACAAPAATRHSLRS